MRSVTFLICSILLLYAAWTDKKEGYIPDTVSVTLCILAVFSLLVKNGPGLSARIAGALLCGGFLELIRLISHGGIGLGDVKLMAACGFLFGPLTGLLSLLLAYVLAGIFCLPALLAKKAFLKTRIPMAPFFAAAVIFLHFFQEPVLNWYLSLWGIL